MLPRSVAFIAAYIVATGALMYANTAWLRLGDVKFGGSGWELYWPLWAVAYAPAVVSAVIAMAMSRRPSGETTGLACGFLAVILAAMELSFVLDLHIVVVAMEWVGLSILFFAARNWLLPPNQPLQRTGAAPRGFEVLDVCERGPGR